MFRMGEIDMSRRSACRRAMELSKSSTGVPKLLAFFEIYPHKCSLCYIVSNTPHQVFLDFFLFSAVISTSGPCFSVDQDGPALDPGHC